MMKFCGRSDDEEEEKGMRRRERRKRKEMAMAIRKFLCFCVSGKLGTQHPRHPIIIRSMEEISNAESTFEEIKAFNECPKGKFFISLRYINDGWMDSYY